MLPLGDYWDKYAQEYKTHYNEELAKFMRDLAVSLRVQSVLEVGCSAGNDLRLFPDHMMVSGIDTSKNAVSKAQETLPQFRFEAGSAVSIPHKDSSFDFVFTRNVLNYVNDSDVRDATGEMFRVSRKYILNIEMFAEDDGQLEGHIPTTGRNMRKHWSDFAVKIISNVDMHEEIDPKRSRFTLIRKI